jgi:hypothetical protein
MNPQSKYATCRHRACPHDKYSSKMSRWVRSNEVACWNCGYFKDEHWGSRYCVDYEPSRCGCGHSKKFHLDHIGRLLCPEYGHATDYSHNHNEWPLCMAMRCKTRPGHKYCYECGYSPPCAHPQIGGCGCGHSRALHRSYLKRDTCFPGHTIAVGTITAGQHRGSPSFHEHKEIEMSPQKNTVPATTVATREQKSLQFTLSVESCNNRPVAAQADYLDGEVQSVTVTDNYSGCGTRFDTTDHIRRAANALNELADLVDSNAFNGTELPPPQKS